MAGQVLWLLVLVLVLAFALAPLVRAEGGTGTTSPAPTSTTLSPTPAELVARWGFHERPKKVLVYFYSPFCGACKAFEATWEAVRAALAEHVSCEPLNCAYNSATCVQGYNIPSYPMLKLFRAGKELIYAGPRSAPDIVAWTLTSEPDEDFVPGRLDEIVRAREVQVNQEKLDWSAYEEPANAVRVLHSSDDYRTSTRVGTWVTKLHIGSGFDRDVIAPYVAIARSYANATIQFAALNVLSDDAVAEEYELSSFPTLVLVHDGRPVRFFSGPFTEKVMGEWIANAISGLAVDDASPTHNERTSDEL